MEVKRLHRIGEKYYWRLVIPKDLIIYFPVKGREIKKSLDEYNQL